MQCAGTTRKHTQSRHATTYDTTEDTRQPLAFWEDTEINQTTIKPFLDNPLDPGLYEPVTHPLPTPTYHDLRHRRRPSWRNACGNGASCRPSSHCAWPTAWPPSSCRPSWRTPSCATHVSWAPWFQRLKTTNEQLLLQLQWEKPKTIRRIPRIAGNFAWGDQMQMPHTNPGNACTACHMGRWFPGAILRTSAFRICRPCYYVRN